MDTSTEYEHLPLNGLATTSDILEEQMRLYGITLDEDNAFQDIGETTTPVPDQNSSDEPHALDSDGQSYNNVETTPAKRYVYDGPADTGKTFGDLLAHYGIPTSVSSLITKAEDAVIGIPEDIQKGDESILRILTKESRLQGIGAALVIVAVIVGILHALL